MARLNNVKYGILLAAYWAGLGLATAIAVPTPAPTSVQVLSSDGSGLSILVTVPGFTPGTQDCSNGHFATLTLPGDGVLMDIGRPALPVIRRLIVVPDAAEATCTFTSDAVATSLSALELPTQIIPVQAPVPKIQGALESAVFAQDTALYSSQEAYPAAPLALTDAGILFGRRLLSLEVCPFAIIPATGALIVHTNLLVTIKFTPASSPASQSAIVTLTAREQSLLAGTVLNPPPADIAVTATQKRLLIIAPDNFTNGLTPFITHKTNRGWLVDCFGTNSTGSTSATIQTFVKNRYTNSPTRPDALLLVGDTAQIPRFVGFGADYPDTDLYYGCMDYAGDWQPEFPVGRFSVSTTNDLAAVLAKSITHEQSPLESWIKRATFMASSDNYTVSEGTHNTVITGTLNRLGYTSNRLYCYSSNATPDQVFNAFNSGCVFGIYSGHGDQYSWADGPVITQNDITHLATSTRYPIICSFACLTGKFSYNTCFAETWLRTPSKGAAAILASSVTSYWTEDDTLEKCFFKAVCDENEPLLGKAIWRAKQLYLATYGTAAGTTRRYFEQYNLFGDPTLEIVGLPVLTNGIPQAWFTSQGITNNDYTLELEKDQDGDGMTALQEYMAGTNPNDPTSSLRLVGGEPSAGSLRLRWLSANSLVNPLPGYQIWARTNLIMGTWMLQTNILIRTPPTNEVQLAIPADTPQLFYRITLTN